MKRAATGPRPARGTVPPLVAAITAVSIVGIGLSLSIPLVSVRLAEAGYSARAIGICTAAGGLANLIGAPFVPWLAQRIGVRRMLIASIAIGAAALLAFAAFAGYAVWVGLRFVYSASLCVLFVMSEYWINTAAPADRRGLVLGFYGTSLSIGFAAGPGVLLLTGTAGVLPFVVAAALFLLASLPVVLAGGVAPPIAARTGLSVAGIVRAAPTASLAALVFGMIDTGALSLLPVYGLANGHGAQAAAALVSFMALGNVAMQIPLGMMSDRLDRGRMMVVCAALACAGVLVMPFVAGTYPLLALSVFAWAGVAAGLYTLGLAQLGARYKGGELATANAAYVMLYSTGLLMGPLVFGVAFDWVGPNGLAYAMAAVLAGYVAIAATRSA